MDFASHGWIEGQTIQMDLRFCRSDTKLVQRYTDELVGLKPDIIFAQGVVGAAAMKAATQTIPVVFVQVQDPVGGGFVTNLARPEGNLTGFTNFEYSIVGKWLQLLKDVSPGVSRVMPMINPDNRPRWNGYTAAFEKYAPALGIKPQMAGIHNESEIEREIAQFRRAAQWRIGGAAGCHDRRARETHHQPFGALSPARGLLLWLLCPGRWTYRL